uniref:Uncharacterized protein n=1 Tax=Arundo donax TaxID=35708 RepID=A0A0A9FDM7_ARUDO
MPLLITSLSLERNNLSRLHSMFTHSIMSDISVLQLMLTDFCHCIWHSTCKVPV